MNIRPMLLDTITIESQSGSDKYGKPAWGSQRTIKVRIQTENRRIATDKGMAFVPVDTLITDEPIQTGDRYWRSGDDTTNEMLAKMLGRVMFSRSLDGSTILYKVDL